MYVTCFPSATFKHERDHVTVQHEDDARQINTRVTTGEDYCDDGERENGDADTITQ